MSSVTKLKGRYIPKESLGQGGMGVVYRARDTVLNCDVAIKMIRDTPDPTALQLFRRECEVLTALNHPNIVQILDLGEVEQDGQTRPFFVMPLLPGSTLEAIIKNGSPLTVERCVDVLTQICRGLGAAHERGLIHRDLKPANVFVMPDDSVEIIDFGVAHMTNSGTSVGQKGTLLFMAPELIEMKPPSPLSDIFALGVMAYEMFTRRRPFARASEAEIIEAILHETPPSISEINPNVNQTIGRVIHKAIAKHPWHRFSTARDFAECLQKASRGERIEYFDPARTRPRLDRAKKALDQGDHQFASEILSELNAEGHLDPDMSLLRRQLDVAVRQKRVQNLLEGARTRLEEDEYPLAMQKVQEALSIEPDNAEALGLKAEIESNSSERQLEGWFRLVRQHIDNGAYGHAREALTNVLQVRPEDTRAKTLLSEVDRMEQAQLRARKEKDSLYHAAVEEYRKGEISSALNKLEKVLEIDRKIPDRSSTDRGATYQGFYNEVRLEQDSMRNSYAEARKHLGDQNFAKALAICDQFLTRFPGHALFQALKFDVEEAQRQRLSGFVAEVDRRVEAELDLQRKENILEEALVQFPGEPHFESSLKLVRNRLSLVNAIVSKARFHEERTQFSEALNQWEILRTIHGKYPGLDFEIERLAKRRDQQARLDAKTQAVERIDAHLQAAEFHPALEEVQASLNEYPNDPELLALQKLAHQGLERKQEAQQALAEGNQLFAGGDFDAGIAALLRARELDQRDAGIRTALTTRLIDRARQILDSDWHASERLANQALELEPGNTAALSLRILLEDRRREELLNQAVAEIRELQTAGNYTGALSKVEQALARFPEETRLKRLQALLADSIFESERARTESEDLKRMQELEKAALAASDPAEVDQLVDQMSRIISRNPLGQQFQTILERARRHSATLRAANAAASQTRSTVFPTPGADPRKPQPSTSGFPLGPAPEPDATAVFILSTIENLPATPPAAQTSAAGPVSPVTAAPTQQVAPEPAPFIQSPAAPAPVSTAISPATKVARPVWWKLAIAALLLLVAGLGLWIFSRPKMANSAKPKVASQIAPAPVEFEVHTEPPGALILAGGKSLGIAETRLRLPPGKYHLNAQKDGYEPASFEVDLRSGAPAPAVTLTLKPLAPSFHVFTTFQSADVFWDDQAPDHIGDNGQYALTSVEPGKHTLRIVSGRSKAAISFESQPQNLPASLRLATSGVDAIALAAYRDQAVVTSSIGNLPVTLDGQPAGKLKAGQIKLNNLTPGSHMLTVGDWSGNFESSASPILNAFLGSLSNQGKLLVEVRGSDNAQILVDGALRGVAQKGRYQLSLDPGDYEVLAASPGFAAAKSQKVSVQKGVLSKLTFLLLPQPAPVAVAALESSIPAKLQGNVSIAVSPANAEVHYALNGETNVQDFRLPSMNLEAGTYVFTARASGYTERTRTVEVAPGSSVSVSFNLTPAKAAAVSPRVVTHTMNSDDWTHSWSMDGSWFTREGGDFVLYQITPTSGVIQFAIAPKSSHGFLGIGGSPKMRWLLDYIDPKNYIECVIDKQSYWSDEYRNGKKVEHTKKKPHGAQGASFQFHLIVEPGGIVVQILSGEKYETLDQWTESGRDFTEGHFGFHLPNQDHIYLTNFLFEQQLAKR